RSVHEHPHQRDGHCFAGHCAPAVTDDGNRPERPVPVPAFPEIPMRTVRGIFVPLLACVLVSCASVAKDDARTCSSAAECDAKWKMAERWIVHRARRSVEHKGDDYMESVGTYGKALVVRVRKVPQGDGSWRIE